MHVITQAAQPALQQRTQEEHFCCSGESGWLQNNAFLKVPLIIQVVRLPHTFFCNSHPWVQNEIWCLSQSCCIPLEQHFLPQAFLGLFQICEACVCVSDDDRPYLLFFLFLSRLCLCLSLPPCSGCVPSLQAAPQIKTGQGVLPLSPPSPSWGSAWVASTA